MEEPPSCRGVPSGKRETHEVPSTSLRGSRSDADANRLRLREADSNRPDACLARPRRIMNREALEEKETVRMEAFSDGVFAFAITLLALNLRDPAGSGVSLSQGLIDEWPAFFAFVTSFVSVLIMWMNHHNMFNYIRKIDRRLMLMNGVLLLFVVLTVFNTSLVAGHIQQADSNVAATLYAGTFFLLAIVWNGLLVVFNRPASSARKRRHGSAGEDDYATIPRGSAGLWSRVCNRAIQRDRQRSRHLGRRRFFRHHRDACARDIGPRRILRSRTGVGETAELRILSGVVVLESGSLEARHGRHTEFRALRGETGGLAQVQLFLLSRHGVLDPREREVVDLSRVDTDCGPNPVEPDVEWRYDCREPTFGDRREDGERAASLSLAERFERLPLCGRRQAADEHELGAMAQMDRPGPYSR